MVLKSISFVLIFIVTSQTVILEFLIFKKNSDHRWRRMAICVVAMKSTLNQDEINIIWINRYFLIDVNSFHSFISSFIFHRANRDRWRHIGKPPHNLIPVKGATHIIACRGYIEFALNDQRALDLLEWSRHTPHPEEVFFSTLNHNPFLKVPGSYLGKYCKITTFFGWS